MILGQNLRWHAEQGIEEPEHAVLMLQSILAILDMSEVRMRPQEIRGFRTEDMALAPAPKPKQKFRLVWDD